MLSQQHRRTATTLPLGSLLQAALGVVLQLVLLAASSGSAAAGKAPFLVLQAPPTQSYPMSISVTNQVDQASGVNIPYLRIEYNHCNADNTDCTTLYKVGVAKTGTNFAYTISKSGSTYTARLTTSPGFQALKTSLVASDPNAGVKVSASLSMLLKCTGIVKETTDNGPQQAPTIRTYCVVDLSTITGSVVVDGIDLLAKINAAGAAGVGGSQIGEISV